MLFPLPLSRLVLMKKMPLPESYIKQFPAVDTDLSVAPTMFSAFVRGIVVRAGFIRNKTSFDTLKNGSTPSFGRRFRFFYSIPETTLLILTNIMGGGANA
jgi:hypothetical protein